MVARRNSQPAGASPRRPNPPRFLNPRPRPLARACTYLLTEAGRNNYKWKSEQPYAALVGLLVNTLGAVAVTCPSITNGITNLPHRPSPGAAGQHPGRSAVMLIHY